LGRRLNAEELCNLGELNFGLLKHVLIPQQQKTRAALSHKNPAQYIFGPCTKLNLKLGSHKTWNELFERAPFGNQSPLQTVVIIRNRNVPGVANYVDHPGI